MSKPKSVLRGVLVFDLFAGQYAVQKIVGGEDHCFLQATYINNELLYDFRDKNIKITVELEGGR